VLEGVLKWLLRSDVMVVIMLMCASETVAIDGDDPHHLDWIYQRSLERAEEFRITGLTYRLTQGRS